MLRAVGSKAFPSWGFLGSTSVAQARILPGRLRHPHSSSRLHLSQVPLATRKEVSGPWRGWTSSQSLIGGFRSFNRDSEVREVFHPDKIQHWFPTEVSLETALENLVLVEQGQLDSDRVTHGNLVELYTDGDTAFSHLFSAIDAAQESIWIEMYLWRNDSVGRAMFDRVLNAVETRGVEVCVMYDSLGSMESPGMRGALHELQRQHPERVRVLAYNHWSRFFTPRTPGYSLMSRNHRKLTVVDNFVAFTGSMNFGDEYGGPAVGGNGRFRDTIVRIEGPAVLHLCSAFLQSMYEAEHHLASRQIHAALQQRLAQIEMLSNAAQTASYYWLKRFYKARRQLHKARKMSVEDAWAGVGAFDPVHPPTALSSAATHQPIPPVISTDPRSTSPYDSHLARADRERLYTRSRKRWGDFKTQMQTKLSQSSSPAHKKQIHKLSSRSAHLKGSVQSSLQSWRRRRPWSFAGRVRRSVLERRTRAWGKFVHSTPVSRLSEFLHEHQSRRMTKKYARQRKRLDEMERRAFGNDPELLEEEQEHDSDSEAGTPPGRDDHPDREGSIFRFLKSYREPEVAPGKRVRSSGCVVEVLQSNPLVAREIQARFVDIVNKTTGPIWISNPYFIPPRIFMDLLISAAKNGRPVNLITCGLSDVPFSKLAAHHVYQQLLVHPNIRIWQHSSVVMHSKTVVIGGVFSMVGSYNFDLLSHLRNAELSVAIVDATLAEGLLRQYGRDLSQCEEVFPEELTITTRLKYWTSYWMVRFMALFIHLS